MEPEVIEPEIEKFIETCDQNYKDLDDETLIEFLNAFEGSKESNRVIRWEISPTLQIAVNPIEREMTIAKESIKRLNSILPSEYEIHIGTAIESNITKPPKGSIYVDFTDPENWSIERTSNEISHPHDNSDSIHGITYGYVNRTTNEISSHIWIRSFNDVSFVNCSDNDLLNIFTHELLHALGLLGHIGHNPKFSDSPFVDKSIMFQVTDCGYINTNTIPGNFDCAGLNAIYTRLENGDYPEELRP